MHYKMILLCKMRENCCGKIHFDCNELGFHALNIFLNTAVRSPLPLLWHMQFSRPELSNQRNFRCLLMFVRTTISWRNPRVPSVPPKWNLRGDWPSRPSFQTSSWWKGKARWGFAHVAGFSPERSWHWGGISHTQDFQELWKVANNDNNNNNNKQMPLSNVNAEMTPAKYSGSNVYVTHLTLRGPHSDSEHLVITEISNINKGSLNMCVYAKLVQLQKTTCSHAYFWTNIFYLCRIWLCF